EAPSCSGRWPGSIRQRIFAAGDARAAGFQVNEQNARGLGSPFAGEAASAEEASTIFFNPAGLTPLKVTQFVAGGSPSSRRPTSTTKARPCAPLSGSPSGLRCHNGPHQGGR